MKARGSAFPRFPRGASLAALQALVVVILAVAITAGPLWMDNAFMADALVPVHVSVTKWSPFYWGQTRYGMLVPLLALPFREPVMNYAVQNLLTASCGLAFFFLSARATLSGIRAAAAGALGAALYIVFDDPDWHHFYFGSISQYGTGLCLSFAGFLLWQKSTGVVRAAAALLLALSVWVDISSPLFLAPWALSRWFFRGDASSRVRAIRLRGFSELTSDPVLCPLLLSLCFASVSAIWISLANSRDAERALGFKALLTSSASSYSEGLRSLGMNFRASLPNGALLGLGSVYCAAFASMLITRRRLVCRRVLDHIGVPTVSLCFRWLVLAGSFWVGENGFAAKYLVPVRVLFFATAAAAAVEALSGLRVRRAAFRFTFIGSTATALLTLVVRHDVLSNLSFRERAMESSMLTRHGVAMVAAECTRIFGSDQNVWEAAFFALETANRNHTTPVLGLSYKTSPFDFPWARVSGGGAKWCSAAEDFSEVDDVRRHLGWPRFTHVERVGNIDLWEPRGEPR